MGEPTQSIRGSAPSTEAEIKPVVHSCRLRFFVCSPKVGDYIDGDLTVWEREPLERLAAEGQLGVHFHHGFWQPMDTLRDRRHLEELWAAGKAPWKIW